MLSITRFHDICAGHIVTGHEGKCAKPHGHGYRIHFTLTAASTDHLGRVVDFSVLKTLLCNWLEEHWDHKFLLWEKDDHPLFSNISRDILENWGVIVVPFNPVAENIARHLVEVVGPHQLLNTGCVLHSCTVEETPKCSATYSLK